MLKMHPTCVFFLIISLRLIVKGQNYDYEEREFEDQDENLQEFRGFADDIQQYENFNEEVRAFDDNFAESFLKAFAGNVRAFNDENEEDLRQADANPNISSKSVSPPRSTVRLTPPQPPSKPTVTKRCKNFQLKLHTWHCAQYLDCFGQEFHGTLTTCPNGQLFDAVQRDCADASEVDCSMVVIVKQ